MLPYAESPVDRGVPAEAPQVVALPALHEALATQIVAGAPLIEGGIAGELSHGVALDWAKGLKAADCHLLRLELKDATALPLIALIKAATGRPVVADLRACPDLLGAALAAEPDVVLLPQRPADAWPEGGPLLWVEGELAGRFTVPANAKLAQVAQTLLDHHPRVIALPAVATGAALAEQMADLLKGLGYAVHPWGEGGMIASIPYYMRKSLLRVVSKPARLKHELDLSPTVFLQTLPRRVVTKPVRIAREIARLLAKTN